MPMAALELTIPLYVYLPSLANRYAHSTKNVDPESV